MIYLTEARTYFCHCGLEILVRTIDGVLPIKVACNECFTVKDIKDDLQPVWFFDCDNCGNEILVDLDYDDTEAILPDVIICPVCLTEYDNTAIGLNE